MWAKILSQALWKEVVYARHDPKSHEVYGLSLYVCMYNNT